MGFKKKFKGWIIELITTLTDWQWDSRKKNNKL